MSENMNKNERKTKKGDFKLAIIATILVIAIVVVAVMIHGVDKKEKEEVIEKQDNIPESQELVKNGASEEDIKLAYGMSKEDAISLVKEIYNGDTYEFSCEINSDSKYVVVVRNTLTNTITKYLVDPTSKDKTFYEIDE